MKRMCSGTRQATKILSFRSSESRSHLLASGLLQLSVEQTLARTRVLDEAAARCDRGGVLCKRYIHFYQPSVKRRLLRLSYLKDKFAPKMKMQSSSSTLQMKVRVKFL